MPIGIDLFSGAGGLSLGAEMAVGAWFPLSAESSTVAGEAGYCDAEVQNVYLRKRLLLAWTRGSNATS